jgi:HTH-type transcriptional regulator/antitoxin HigA
MDKEQSRKMKTKISQGGLPDLANAWAIVQSFAPLHPLRSEVEYDRMVELTDRLVDVIGDNEDHPLFSLYDLATDLIGAWEKEHISFPETSPRELLRYLIESNGLRQKDLHDIASPTLLSDILSGRRAISKNVAKALAERFHVEVGAFL